MKKTWLYLIFCFLPMMTLASTSFTQGKDYKVIKPAGTTTARISKTPGKVSVVEFFSYGCPWCFHLETSLEKWLKHKPAYVNFSRVPVVFESGWQTYAKAYYIADALGILPKVTPAIFKAIHVQNENLTSKTAMQKFFAQFGVSQTQFNNAFEDNTGLKLQLEYNRNLLLSYRVFAVPTIVVGGKYYTSAELSKGNDKQMMQVVAFLVQKVKNEETKHHAY